MRLRSTALLAGVLAGALVMSEAIGGDKKGAAPGTENLSESEKVLRALKSNDGVLINLSASDLPSTTDMIRLGRQATPAIVNGLVNSMNASVRSACAAVLTGTRDPRAVDALLDALDDPNESVRHLAITALGQVESGKATKRLLGLLDKPNTSYGIKRAALKALGRLGDARAVRPLLGYFERTWDGAAQDALWEMRRQLKPTQLRRLVVTPLVAASRGGDNVPSNGVLSTAVQLAATLKIKGAGPPMRQIFESHSGLQNKILNALGRIGDRAAVPFLKGLLDPAAPARVLNNVAFALDRLGQDVSGFLKQSLGDRRAYIRFNAAFVAGDLKAKTVVPELLTALRDPNDYVRSNAAIALGNIASKDAIAGLQTASQEKNPVVKADALLALARIDYPSYRDRVVNEIVYGRHSGSRSKAIAFLSTQKDPKVIEPVLRALDPQGWSDRSAGLQLLEAFDDVKTPAASAFLLRIAARDDYDGNAYRLLGRFTDPQAEYVLRQWLSQPGSNVEQLLRIAGRYKNKASVPAIVPWTSEKRSLSAQLHAAFALSQIAQDERSGDTLVNAISSLPLHFKRTAARLLTEVELGKIGGLDAKLQALLKHEDVYVRLYAARALMAKGDPGAAQVLLAELKKKVPFIRDEVLDITERTPPKFRDPVLMAWLVESDVHLRRDIERILKRNN
jgi:HEAT repeat protein